MVSMALTIDISRQFRSIGELIRLVEAVAAAPTTESEPDWLEWKREADLTDRRWHAQIAKFIAGVANRDPSIARQSAGGCAYLVIGAEPGGVSGVSPIDNASLNDGISRFVRIARWSPQYVDYAGKQVLVVTVEPPEYGDPTIAMLTAYQSGERGASVCREGDVFVRRHGSTNLATQEDHHILNRRFAASAEQASGMSIEQLGPVTAVPVAIGPDEITAWRQGRERALLAPLEKHPSTQFGSSLSLLYERRRPSQYQHEVESYLTEAAALLKHKAHAEALTNRPPGMKLVLTNDTEHNYTAVRVEVSIEGEVWAYEDAEDALSMMPTPPRAWGTSAIDYLPHFPIGPTYGPYIDNTGSAHIRFDDVDLRPSGTVHLDPLHLVTGSTLAGKTLTAKWTATSVSVSGVARGEFPIVVSPRVNRPLTK